MRTAAFRLVPSMPITPRPGSRSRCPRTAGSGSCRAGRPRTSAGISGFCTAAAVVGLCLHLQRDGVAVHSSGRSRIRTEPKFCISNREIRVPWCPGAAMGPQFGQVENHLCALVRGQPAVLVKFFCGDLGALSVTRHLLFGKPLRSATGHVHGMDGSPRATRAGLAEGACSDSEGAAPRLLDGAIRHGCCVLAADLRLDLFFRSPSAGIRPRISYSSHARGDGAYGRISVLKAASARHRVDSVASNIT